MSGSSCRSSGIWRKSRPEIRTRLAGRARPRLVRLAALFLPAFCLAQTPTVGVIEIYGARKTPVDEIQRIVGVNPGGRLPVSKGAVEDRLQAITGITLANLEAACCERGRVILYVGVHEQGGAHLAFREYPSDSPDMPEPVSRAYTQFLDRVRDAGRDGQGSEDLSQGHSLLASPAARQAQMDFIPLANIHGAELRNVLRNSADSDHRAMAAYVMGYGSDKKAVLEDLSYALRDPDATVRANATRALAAIAVYAAKNPQAGLQIQPAWFVDLLNSPVFTDRNNAATALVTLTESREPGILEEIRTGALLSIVEMARWKHLPHALPAYILLGRTAGMRENELQSAWSKGQRDSIIARATGLKKR